MFAKLALASVLFGGVAAFVPAPPSQQAESPDGRFKIDPVHSSVIFKVRHMNTASFYGRFNAPTGMVLIDADTPADSMVKFSIPTKNIDTGNADRDKHLRGADFFNADEFANIEFESTKVVAKGKDGYDVTGDLTLHGVKKSMTVHVQKSGFSHSAQMGTVVGLETTFQFKRSDFGMSMYLEGGVLGDEIDVILSIEAAK